MSGLTHTTRTSIFRNFQHYAVYVSTIGSCMPSRRLRRLDAPLVESRFASKEGDITTSLFLLAILAVYSSRYYAPYIANYM